MPRASWRGFLRLSLVSCPVYLSPATTRAKAIRLRQVWQPAPPEERDVTEEPEDYVREGGRGEQVAGEPEGDDDIRPGTAAPIVIRPHHPETGEELDKSEVVKGYEYGRGQFVTFTAKELKALDVESSKIIDLEQFTPRSEIDPIYFDTPYYVYPDGPVAAEAMRVIGAAMAEAGVAGIGRLTLSRRERMIMIEPRGTGMALFMLRAATEVRASQFASPEGELDAEMVAVAGAIIAQRTGKLDPSSYRDRYQEALRELIEAKLRGIRLEPRAVPAPAPVVDLMTALKRSLAQARPGSEQPAKARPGRRKATTDRRQPALLLPLSGARKRQQSDVEPAGAAQKRRKKA